MVGEVEEEEEEDDDEEEEEDLFFFLGLFEFLESVEVFFRF